jgi:magnesium transporter
MVGRMSADSRATVDGSTSGVEHDCHVFDEDGPASAPFSARTIERLLGAGRFFWLDLPNPAPGDFDLLRDAFGFHRLAVEDAEEFTQRPKIDDYDDHVFLVAYGAAPDADEDRLAEVHCFVSERAVVTVHRDEAPSFVDLRERWRSRSPFPGSPATLVHNILDALTDSFFPLLSELRDRFDMLEGSTSVRTRQAEVEQIFGMRLLLVGLGSAIRAQRDLLQGIAGGSQRLPGMTREYEREFRDVYDHLIQLSDQIDRYHELMTSSIDVHLMTVSNRLNVVMKELAVIATVFLPLTFITGFFGQNFTWLVDRVGTLGWFLALGVGLEVVVVTCLLLLARRRGWL